MTTSPSTHQAALTLTFVDVVNAGLKFLREGRLQASLARRHETFRGACRNNHPITNGFGQSVHCIFGAWAEDNGIAEHNDFYGSAQESIRFLVAQGLLIQPNLNHMAMIAALQGYHDECCTRYVTFKDPAKCRRIAFNRFKAILVATKEGKVNSLRDMQAACAHAGPDPRQMPRDPDKLDQLIHN